MNLRLSLVIKIFISPMTSWELQSLGLLRSLGMMSEIYLETQMKMAIDMDD